VYDVRINDAVLQGEVVQHVEHVLDGDGQHAASTHDAEDCLKQVVNVLLQRALSQRNRQATPSPPPPSSG
jgi:hypothetical protein